MPSRKSTVKKLLPLVGLWGINDLLVWLFRKDLAKEYLIRGTKYLRKIDAKFPLYVGRNVILRGCENIKFGQNVVLHDNVYLNAKHGVNNCIKIGSNTSIDVFTSIWGEGGVEIGEQCAIAAGVRIYSQANQYDYDEKMLIVDQPIKYAKVKIGDDVWIGTNAVILPGVEIGSHSVIGAGSVVTKTVPPNSVVVGIPAKVIKKRKMKTPWMQC